MLRECKEHSYFRGEVCPVCGVDGKFLMSDEEIEKMGKTMAGILRHFPERFGLRMDSYGWVSLQEFLPAIQKRQRRFRWIRQHHIKALIDTDPKGRYQFEDGYIRATYGHSVDVQLDLPTDNIPDTLYYPTTKEEVDILLETGLKPSDRKKLHLSKAYENALEAGKVRVKNPIIISIDAKGAIDSGITIYQAGTTVYLTDEIPAEFLSKEESRDEPGGEGEKETPSGSEAEQGDTEVKEEVVKEVMKGEAEKASPEKSGDE